MSAQGEKMPEPNYWWLIVCQLLSILGFFVGATHDTSYLAQLIAGVCFVIFLVSPFCGIVVGHIACYRIKKATGVSPNKSGLIANYVIAMVIVFLLVNFMPGFLEARSKSQCRRCRENMRVIHAAMEKYRADHSNGPAIIALSNLVPLYLTAEPHCPKVSKMSYVIDRTNCVHCPVENKYPEHKATQ